MANIILSINAGSSSLKTTLFVEQEKKLRRLASAEVSAINQPPSRFKYTRGSYKDTSDLDKVHDHQAAFEHILDAFLADQNIPELSTKEDIHYTGHRVVQGGGFEEPQFITRETFEKINKLSDLAPLYSLSLPLSNDVSKY